MVEKKTQMLIAVAILIVVVASVRLYLLYDLTSRTSNNNSTSLAQPTPWQVVNSNVTLCGGVPDMPRYLFSGIEIARISLPASVECFPKLNVELISYQDNYYYYSGNYTYTKNQEQITRTIWLTNSTIFCITPKFEEYNTCPTQS